MEDKLFEVLMYTVPAVIVFLTAFNILKKFFEQEQSLLTKFFEQERATRNLKLKEKKNDVVLPIRLQSYERIVLFLDRIAPENMLIREHKQGMTAVEFHQKLIDIIQKEYEHNVAQQIYISSNAWNHVKNAKDETIKVVNLAMNKMGKDATGMNLTEFIFGILSQVGTSPSHKAVEVLKQEARKLM